MSKYLFYFIVPMLLVGCSSREDFILFNKVHPEKNIESTEFNNVKFEYKIVPHDRVSLIVYQHPEFSTSSLITRKEDVGLLVNADGTTRFPLIKSVHIAGLTQQEALEKVERGFAKYLKSPDIYLEVLNKRAYVIGEVKQPGEISITNEKMSLIQAISKAGDLTDLANREEILVLRSTSHGIQKSLVNLTDINSLSVANMVIYPNDIVYVLPNDMKAFNVNAEQINPALRMITNILSPFVSIKYLSE